MRRILGLLAIGAALSGPALADDDGAVVSYQSLKPEFAARLAEAAMLHCREQGYQVGVAVVDRFGGLQVFMRDRFAGAHTIETAERKAWTAVSFRTNTSELDGSTQPGTESFGIRYISRALPLGGGMMIESAGSLIGGVGVSGAPGPHLDDECAEAGIAAIEDDLGF
ncbi:heme-binding protein [Rhodobacteraceae bacterium NNCM2]|nr:heme-binding protein [Coraliihabitans acroporae]